MQIKRGEFASFLLDFADSFVFMGAMCYTNLTFFNNTKRINHGQDDIA